MLSIFKPSTLFTSENAVGRLLAHPLTTPVLAVAKVSLICFLYQRPAQDFPLWVVASLFLLIPALFAVTSLTATPAWRSEIYHREFFVFILAIPLAVSWLPRTTEVPADNDQFL